MTASTRPRPPALARRLLAAVLPASVAGRSTAGDLIEEFHRRPSGWRRRVWFWTATLDLAARYVPGRIAGLLASLRRDLVYAGRLAWRYPAISLTAIVSLGLAIGVTTAAFTVVNGRWLREHLAVDPEVVSIWRLHATGASALWPAQEFAALREAATLLSIEGKHATALTVRAEAEQEADARATVLFVTGSYLTTFEAGPAMGRLLTDADDRRGAAPVAVLDHLFWRRQFAGDADIIGRMLVVGEASVRVVGVAHRDYLDPNGRQPVLWVPLAAFDRVAPIMPGTGPQSLNMVARVRPELVKSASTELASLVARLPPTPGTRPATGGGIGPVTSDDEIATTTRVLVGTFAVVALVLVLAVANVSNLQLAGAAARRREIAVRCSCGASPRRIVRQMAMESLLLAGAAGAVGFVSARWFALSFAAGLGDTTADLDPDGRVYLFILAATILVAVGVGLAPALYAARRDVSANLAGPSSRTDSAADPGRARSVFIGIQAAASVVIVALAALLVRALLHVAWLDPGYDIERLLTVSSRFSGSPADRARARDFWPAALERVRGLPGVEDASLSYWAPFGVTLGNPDTAHRLPTDANYFSTLGLPVVAGRTYTSAEVAGRAPVAVISENAARRFWGDRNPLGDPISRIERDWPPHQIVGIVADALTFRVHGEHVPFVYVPMPSPDAAQLTIRTNDPEALARPVHDALHALAVDAQPSVTVLTERFDRASTRQTDRARRYAMLGAGLASFALLLSIVGLVGVTSFSVRTRAREIAIRTALGSRPRDVVRLCLRDGLSAVVVGIVIGTAGALFAGRFIAAMLYGVSDRDPLALAGASGTLLLAALVAVYIPTRRAVRRDPARVLRDA
jgi:predicted permease